MARIIKVRRNELDPFEADEYEIDLDYMNFNRDMRGCIRAQCAPIFGLPITLNVDICPDGHVEVCNWCFDGNTNRYLHVSSIWKDVKPTEAQRETVLGIFSGRVRVEGLKLAVGKSLQDLCDITAADLQAESNRVGSQILLA